MIEILPTDFVSILPLWRAHLWPNRRSQITPTSALRFGGGVDLTLLEQDPIFLAAKINGETVGAISGFQTGPNSFRVRGVTVVPEWRGKGVGRQLLTSLLDHAETSGFGMMWTAPRKDNLGFYERHGFSKMSDWTQRDFENGQHCYAARHSLKPSFRINRPRFDLPSRKVVFDVDAFSSGQILSKIWLCEELERVGRATTISPAILWNLCGWCGVLPFLLFTRGNMKIKTIRSFDIDPDAALAADRFLNTWEWQGWTFKALCQDIQTLDYSQPQLYHSDPPNIVINCAIEHLPRTDWWARIPDQTLVVLQATDMRADDHFVSFGSIEDVIGKYPVKEVLYSGAKHFSYASGFKFSRFMVIGRK